MHSYVQKGEYMILESLFAFISKIFCFTSYINSSEKFPEPLSKEDEQKYLVAYKENGDKRARELLIKHNLRLVAHIVKKYANAGDMDDFISIGSIGLIKGIESYQIGRGTSLATYTAKCIDNEILMNIRTNKKHKSNVSLSVGVGTDKDGNEITLMDILPSRQDSVESAVETEMMIDLVKDIVNTKLSGRERLIIRMRYSIGYDKMYTQLEIAEKLGISRSYVSRIEKKALKKISKIIGC